MSLREIITLPLRYALVAVALFFVILGLIGSGAEWLDEKLAAWALKKGATK